MTTETKKSLGSKKEQSFAIPKSISSIRNECLNVCHDLNNLKQNIEERLNVLDQNDEKVTALNYKMYQIRYNYSTKIRDFIARKHQLESTKTNEAQMALSLMGKEIEECKQQHNLEHDTTKRHMVEAQEEYEDILGVLDNSLDGMKAKLGDLFLLMEARKTEDVAVAQDDTALLMTQVGEYEQFVDYYTEIQTVGWSRRKDVKVPTDVNGLRYTEEGLLATDSGHELSYEDTVDQNLLHNMHPIFSTTRLVNTPEGIESSSASKTASSGTKMSSEDVAYLKHHLGGPLTLALAEITAVQPRDPIHYLGHWLFKYRYNEEVGELRRMEVEELTMARRRLAEEEWHKFVEEEAKAAVFDLIGRVEEEALRNELLRMEREYAEQEEENFDDEARDKFDAFGGGMPI